MSDIEIGDVVIALNEYGKKKCYIIVRVGNKSTITWGITVVKKLYKLNKKRKDETYELHDEFGTDYGYVILRELRTNMEKQDIVRKIGSVGVEKGNEIKRLSYIARKNRIEEIKRHQRVNNDVTNDDYNYRNSEYIHVCSGGMARPK